ncbi:MAG: hypothetical protein IJV02_00325 [Candidatus Methanomethylophilaceae archaeon]|nr:hypothetical protein [Candidatus Methanomethylophilaceae archaeon]MBQ7620846.1 hypothetical protein [Candidatus Methanomethylophilaceae archaeon]
MSIIGRILSSDLLPLAGLVRTSAAVALIMVGVRIGMFEKINLTQWGVIPDAYLPLMLVFAIILGALACRGASLYWYRKNANYKEGEKEDSWYRFSTLVSLILGIAFGMYMSIPLTDAAFIGAGQWTYALIAGILAAIGGIIADFCFRFGIREFLIKAPQVAKDLKAAIEKAQGELKE